jgi:hypothetical protein
MPNIVAKLLVLLLLSMHIAGVQAQNLEPRRWTLLPVNKNFIGVGTGNSRGDILLDSALQIEDGTMDSYFLSTAYIRSFGLFGNMARIEVTLPYALGRWEGMRAEMPVSTRRHGFGDPGLRFSYNFMGSPALQGKEFAAYRAANPVRTLMGVGVDVTLPLGEYYQERLINLGNNRYVVRPQFGILHQRHQWEFEITTSVFLFGENKDFINDTKREQDPLWFAQAHVNYSFTPGIWAGLGAGYGYGGSNTIAGDDKNDDGRVSFWALSFGMPLSMRQSVKLTYAISQTNTRTGSDLDSIIGSWNMMF